MVVSVESGFGVGSGVWGGGVVVVCWFWFEDFIFCYLWDYVCGFFV